MFHFSFPVKKKKMMTEQTHSQIINSKYTSKYAGYFFFFYIKVAQGGLSHNNAYILLMVFLSDDDCTDSFTPNQVARMHCYLDLVYQGWQPFSKPPPVAIAPQIIEHTYTSVTLEWFPPIDGYIFER